MNSEKIDTDRCAMIAELSATIPPHIRRLESVESELDGYIVSAIRRAVEAELALLIELQRSRREVQHG
jgi:hypothetical protein